jgi:chromosome segregation ATPase
MLSNAKEQQREHDRYTEKLQQTIKDLEQNVDNLTISSKNIAEKLTKTEQEYNSKIKSIRDSEENLRMKLSNSKTQAEIQLKHQTTTYAEQMHESEETGKRQEQRIHSLQLDNRILQEERDNFKNKYNQLDRAITEMKKAREDAQSNLYKLREQVQCLTIDKNAIKSDSIEFSETIKRLTNRETKLVSQLHELEDEVARIRRESKQKLDESQLKTQRAKKLMLYKITELNRKVNSYKKSVNRTRLKYTKVRRFFLLQYVRV